MPTRILEVDVFHVNRRYQDFALQVVHHLDGILPLLKPGPGTISLAGKRKIRVK